MSTIDKFYPIDFKKASSYVKSMLQTKAEMLADTYGYNGKFTICSEDKKLYIYDNTKTAETETGNYHKYEGQIIEYDTMPTASEELLTSKLIVIYTGDTTTTAPIYTKGHMYYVISDGATTPTYSWEEVKGDGIVSGADFPATSADGDWFYLTAKKTTSTKTYAIGLYRKGATDWEYNSLYIAKAKGNRDVEVKTDANGQIVFAEKAVAPKITSMIATPSSITAGTSTTVSVSIVLAKGDADLSSAVLKAGSTTIHTKTDFTTLSYAVSYNISAETEFTLTVEDVDGYTATDSVTVTETSPIPSYTGKFGTVGGGTSDVTIYSKAYSGTITMTNDKIVYKYPSSLGNLTSILGNGVDYSTFFTATTEEISGTQYYVYTQNLSATVTNFSIIFS